MEVVNFVVDVLTAVADVVVIIVIVKNWNRRK